MELRKLGMVGLGFVAGIAFVVACPSPQDVMPGLGSSGGGGSTGGLFGSSTASAADIESECMQGEVQFVSVPSSSGVPEIGAVTTIPAGRTPIGSKVQGSGGVLLRRCTD